MVAKNTFRGGVSEREFDGGKNKNTAIAAHVHRNFTFTKNFIASALLAFVTSAHGLLTTASLRGKEKYSYNVATVPLLAEALKLSISFVLLKRELRLMASSSSSSSESASTKVVMTTQVKTVMLYPIPSLIFLLHQAVSFPALVLLDPTTFLVLGNLKIVITGVLTRIF